jgi:murein L,D-transpeptidase YcbB/YkuD
LPKDFHGDYLMVNIPDFKLLLYKNNKLNFSCKVVLGKQSTGTVIFNANMEYVVFSPYWNIPNSIIKKEIIPSILKNENYLEQHNMEIVTNDREVVKTSSIRWKEYLDKKFPYVIREKPGPSNSLGLVKFIFPNSHDIYLHDTPAKQLFSQTTRTFSHGCIRVEKPFELAQILLKNDTAWTNEKIKQNMNGGVELWVRLPQKMQVYIVYFTSWVDAAGAIQFRNDVYGHDKKMNKMLL